MIKKKEGNKRQREESRGPSSGEEATDTDDDVVFTWSLQLGQTDRHVNFGKRFQIKRVRRIQRYNVAQIPTASKSVSNLATGSFTYLLIVAHRRLKKANCS